MSEIKGIMKNVDVDSIIAFLLNEPETLKGAIEVSDRAVQDSYNNFIDKLVGLYPSASMDNDDLFDAVTEFAEVHEEIYFKMGLIVGAGLVRDLEKRYTELKLLGIVK